MQDIQVLLFGTSWNFFFLFLIFRQKLVELVDAEAAVMVGRLFDAFVSFYTFIYFLTSF